MARQSLASRRQSHSVERQGMKPCGSPAEYLDLTCGRYFVGEGFVAWQSETKVSGFTVWGRPAASSAALLNQLLDVAEREPHFSLVDVRALTGVDYEAFDVFFRGIRARQPRFATSILKQGVLRPEGPVGAIVLGFYGLMTVRYPVKHFTALEDAIDWFDIDDRPRILSELGSMMTSVQGVPEIVARLRATMATIAVSASPTDLARELGMSRRTLQRRLESIGTSLRDEMHAYRIERTKVLLTDSNSSLISIAETVGFESVRTLNDVFRKHTGTTPREYREKSR